MLHLLRAQLAGRRSMLRFGVSGTALGLMLVVSPVLAGLPASAEPAYYLPFPNGVGYTITQSPGGSYSHNRDSTRYAVDFGTGAGATVVASAPGTVKWARDRGDGFGNAVWIDHGGGVCTIYAHLATVSVGEGATVGQAQQVGTSGSTGQSTGPHLHWGKMSCPGYTSQPISTVETGSSFPEGSRPISQNAPPSQPPPPAARYRPNLLTSSSFEDGMAGWGPGNGEINYTAYPSGGGVRALEGARYGAWNTAVAGRSLAQSRSLEVKAGDSYTASIWVRSSSGQFRGKLNLWGLGNGQEASGTDFVVGEKWKRVSVALNAVRDHSALKLEIYGTTTGKDLFVDGATLATSR